MISENVSWRSVWTISKFSDPGGCVAQLTRDGVPVEQVKKMFPDLYRGVEVIEGNLALNEGLQEVIDLACGLGTPTAFSNANARIGVGDGITSEVATQTGLVGTNKLYKAMDSGYPQRSGQTVTFQATFGSSEANYNWREYSVANGSSDTAKNLNRKVVDKGTKVNGETWVIQVSITFS